MDFARGALGAELDVDPLTGILLSVRLAAGTVAYWRLRLSKIAEGDPAGDPLEQGYRLALADLSKFSKAALDAGVNERLVRIAERAAEQITAAAEEALASITLPAKDRALFISAFAGALARREDDVIDVVPRRALGP